VVAFVVAVNNFGDTRSGGLAGPMGLFIIVLMAIAVVLLIRNMNKRVRRLPDSFPDPETERGQAEVARLDADPGTPGAGPQRPHVDDSRSRPTGGRAESEVNRVGAAEPPTERRMGQDRP
jgi:hypothetical protein